ncbi:Mrp/NBP35 family ATP-binding protein [Rhodocaloribacter litoris]|uniref:Mrp/NBP35 family ATP-binding protein n=1 Tax=Rhodocaloribacter litoris TaxID=2558931 RepID=UPI00142010C4|nr:Mrp/NBP35 family ATP-binding protein [Rhodocaloribacter litoris]QXD15942.1 Mrp/NBP35 family ATP-binding protein [Rhodocaloribacter litoris]GIV60154.1 MAG: iron-sulfur cluster carrier protein [Rhodothermaceae bacterium]
MKTYHDIATDGGSNVAAQVGEQAARLARRLAGVRHVVAVMSGKGGVGKSAVTVNLGAALALDGLTVGLLDADINGPSLARMTGVLGQPLRLEDGGVQPAEAAPGLKVMSIDLLLADEHAPVLWEAPTQRDAFTWRGLMEMHAVREFLTDTAWGRLDVLLIDLPPGTDKLPNLVDLLPALDGTLVVTLPSGVSQHVVGKSIRMATAVLGTPVIGLVENMASYACPHCGREAPLFPTGEAAALAARHGIPYLGGLPFDPRLSAAADRGTAFMVEYADTPAGRAFRRLAEQVRTFLNPEHPFAPSPRSSR